MQVVQAKVTESADVQGQYLASRHGASHGYCIEPSLRRIDTV